MRKTTRKSRELDPKALARTHEIIEIDLAYILNIKAKPTTTRVYFKTQEYHESLPALLEVTGYGDLLQNVDEILELEGNQFLVCATISCWGGTFSSHDEIEVRWYHIYPKENNVLRMA